jgi:predicted DNA-binding transcriptional regulator AlpA
MAELIRVTEAMRRLPFGRTQFYKHVRSGRLPPILKLPGGGRASFMDAEALDKIINEMIREGKAKE